MGHRSVGTPMTFTIWSLIATFYWRFAGFIVIFYSVINLKSLFLPFMPVVLSKVWNYGSYFFRLLITGLINLNDNLAKFMSMQCIDLICLHHYKCYRFSATNRKSYHYEYLIFALRVLKLFKPVYISLNPYALIIKIGLLYFLIYMKWKSCYCVGKHLENY